MNQDEIGLALEILLKITAQRKDLKRFALIQKINENLKDIRKLREINEELILLLRHEEMEILYPFLKNKISARAFGKVFLEGYFDWSHLSEDPYELLRMIEEMREDLETSLYYLKKNIADKSSIGKRQKRRHSL